MTDVFMETSVSTGMHRSSMHRLEIPIFNGENQRVGKLIAFSDETVADAALVEMLTSWRNRHRQFFLTQFEATVPRTRQWLEHTILADSTRVMFFIHEHSGEPIGHIGVLRLDQPTVELDNMIRGRSGGNGQLMHWAEVALLRWLFEVRRVSGVCLQVLANNWIPIRLHSMIGFRVVEALPLVRQELNDEIHLVVSPDVGNVLETKLWRMELSHYDFTNSLACLDTPS